MDRGGSPARAAATIAVRAVADAAAVPAAAHAPTKVRAGGSTHAARLVARTVVAVAAVVVAVASPAGATAAAACCCEAARAGKRPWTTAASPSRVPGALGSTRA